MLCDRHLMGQWQSCQLTQSPSVFPTLSGHVGLNKIRSLTLLFQPQKAVNQVVEDDMGGCQKYGSFLEYPKYQVPYYNSDPKGDHNFDNNPYCHHHEMGRMASGVLEFQTALFLPDIALPTLVTCELRPCVSCANFESRVYLNPKSM